MTGRLPQWSAVRTPATTWSWTRGRRATPSPSPGSPRPPESGTSRLLASDYYHDDTLTRRLLQVMQISCNAPWKPAEGCLQYYTGDNIFQSSTIQLTILPGTTGTIYSYNYDGSYHLVNQHYDNCIRWPHLTSQSAAWSLLLQDGAGLLQHLLHCRHPRDQWTPQHTGRHLTNRSDKIKWSRRSFCKSWSRWHLHPGLDHSAWRRSHSGGVHQLWQVRHTPQLLRTI